MSLLRNIGSVNANVLPAPPGDTVQDIAAAPADIVEQRPNVFNVVPGTGNRNLSIGALPFDWKQLIKPVLIVGGLYLISRQGKSVSGRPGKKSMLPLLLAGGAAAYYFYNKSKGAAVIPIPVPGDGPGGGGPAGGPTGISDPYGWGQYISVEQQRGDLSTAKPEYKDSIAKMSDEELRYYYQAMFISGTGGIEPQLQLIRIKYGINI